MNSPLTGRIVRDQHQIFVSRGFEINIGPQTKDLIWFVRISKTKSNPSRLGADLIQFGPIQL